MMNTHDPSCANCQTEIDSLYPFVGQVVTFTKDSTCKIINKGNGPWSSMDNYIWWTEKNDLKYKNKGRSTYIMGTFSCLSFNSDSIILYVKSIGVENGFKMVTIYKLIKFDL